jgi:hypothetical protein
MAKQFSMYMKPAFDTFNFQQLQTYTAECRGREPS